MTKQIKYKSLIWLDLTNPTKEEIASLPDNFKVHPLIKEELRHPSPRPKICLLYTSDAADDLLCVDLGGRSIIKKKKKSNIRDLTERSTQ